MTEAENIPSLRLSFDVTRTQVELRTQPAFQSDFAQLTALIAASGQRGPVAATVSLDNFLVGLSELGNWTHPGVVWDADLMALVNGVLDDAETVQHSLSGRPSVGAADTVQPQDVLGLLGPGWTAGLTSFQQRDIARLLSLRHSANFSVPGAGENPRRARRIRRDARAGTG